MRPLNHNEEQQKAERNVLVLQQILCCTRVPQTAD